MSSMFFLGATFLFPLAFYRVDGLTTALLFGARICITSTFTVVYIYAPEVSWNTKLCIAKRQLLYHASQLEILFFCRFILFMLLIIMWFFKGMVCCLLLILWFLFIWTCIASHMPFSFKTENSFTLNVSCLCDLSWHDLLLQNYILL